MSAPPGSAPVAPAARPHHTRRLFLLAALLLSGCWLLSEFDLLPAEQPPAPPGLAHAALEPSNAEAPLLEEITLPPNDRSQQPDPAPGEPSPRRYDAIPLVCGVDVSQGAVQVDRPDGSYALPLLHTSVEAEISGYIAEATVTQVFANPFDEPIEAIYLFPLPDEAAVDAMTLRIGERVIEGQIKRRAEAKQIYEAAKRQGKTAALLDQERPNIFTQRVAGILPGETLEVQIHFVQPLSYDKGGYEWAFPMVVGPRYIPQDGTGHGEADRQRLAETPISARRTGNDISLTLRIDAGIAIQSLSSPSHDIDVERDSPSRAELRITPADSLPNKDFILRYEVAGERPEAAVLSHRGEEHEDGFFLLMVQPPAERFVTDEMVTPKEMIFVVDSSCSMSGFPMDKAKQAMELAIDGMNPEDRFLVMDFNDRVSQLAASPLPNTLANRRLGRRFVQDFQGSGGTRMLDGIEAALDLPADPDLLRTVFFLTDGYIGNEREILSSIEQRLGRSRLHSLGVGSSVNRYLLDRMAKVGRGSVQYVRPDEDADAAVRRFYERVRSPLITDIELSWEGVELLEVYPDPVPDLFAGQPLFVLGRYRQGGAGSITVRGLIRGEPWEQRVEVDLPEREPDHGSLAPLWARRVLQDLSLRSHEGQTPGIEDEMTELALRFHLSSEFTSFVAVDSRVVTDGAPSPVQVPLENVEFVDHEQATGGQGVVGVQAKGSPASCGFRFGGEEEDGGSLGGFGRGGGGYGMGTVGSGGLGTRGSGFGAGGYGAGGGYYGKQGGSSPGLAPGSPIVLGAIDKSGIDRVVKQHLAQVRYCYEKQLKRDPSLAGKVTIRFTIDADGKVSAASVKQSSLDSAAVEQCLISRFKRMRFPSPRGGGVVVVTYPLVFASGG